MLYLFLVDGRQVALTPSCLQADISQIVVFKNDHQICKSVSVVSTVVDR